MSKKKCPDCGGPIRSYHGPGITRLVCSEKCRGWHVIETINHREVAMEKPKFIVLCGSTRFCQQMAVVAWYLEKEEGAIVMGLHLLPWWYPDVENIPDHLAEHEGVKEHCDNLHMRKIDLADEIFVVDVDLYTGNSTKREIEYAINRGLPVRYYSAEPMGLRVDGIYNAAVKKAFKMSACKTRASDFTGSIVELNDFLECGKCDYLDQCLVPQYLIEDNG